MKASTIQKEIRKKIFDYAESIENKSLSDDFKEGCIVTGGCITSMFLQEDVNDYDIYLNDNALAFRLAVYYINKIETSAKLLIRLTYNCSANKDVKNCKLLNGEATKTHSLIDDNYYWLDKTAITAEPGLLDISHKDIKKHLENVTRIEIYLADNGFVESKEDKKSKDEGKYNPVFLSPNAITLSNKVQIILRFTGSPERIHESYDFVHATNYWTKETGLVTTAKALESILSKELIYRGSLYPLASIFRTRKFIQRGWRVHVGNYIKMAMQLNYLDLSNIETLEEQLTGVDSLYLSSLINAMKKKEKESSEFKITELYICELCDKMMNVRGDD